MYENFDFKNPRYSKIFQDRLEFLKKIRKNPEVIPQLRLFYRDNPAQFICDWGCTYDPKNSGRGQPALVPFILFPRQIEVIAWIIECWKNKEPGVLAKSRQVGLSWVTVALACTLCLFHDDLVIGFGSRKMEYVDKSDDPKALFYKARLFIENLPVEFRGEWSRRRDSPYMRLSFPMTGATMIGEGGDNLGRGGTTSLTFVDEYAFFQRPQLVEASLSETTDCRIDISTPCGPANAFARKWLAKKIKNFAYHWRDDPRKDQAWYDKKCLEINDPVIIAQEYDLDFTASVEGVLIPSLWVQSAIDAHIKLGIQIYGTLELGFDVADKGRDKHAIAGRYGILLQDLDQWQGTEEHDIYAATQKVLTFSDVRGYNLVKYDGDGLGAGVRGDSRVLNKDRLRRVKFIAFRGSGKVVDGRKLVYPGEKGVWSSGEGRTNEDFFENAKAQAWWDLRRRFELTYRAVVKGFTEYNRDELISISSDVPFLSELTTELSQPTYSQTKASRIIVDKAPDDARSPNLADAVNIAYATIKTKSGF